MAWTDTGLLDVSSPNNSGADALASLLEGPPPCTVPSQGSSLPAVLACPRECGGSVGGRLRLLTTLRLWSARLPGSCEAPGDGATMRGRISVPWGAPAPPFVGVRLQVGAGWADGFGCWLICGSGQRGCRVPWGSRGRVRCLCHYFGLVLWWQSIGFSFFAKSVLRGLFWW